MCLRKNLTSQPIDLSRLLSLLTLIDLLTLIVDTNLNNCVGLHLNSAKQIILKFSSVKKFTNPVLVQILPVRQAG